MSCALIAMMPSAARAPEARPPPPPCAGLRKPVWNRSMPDRGRHDCTPPPTQNRITQENGTHPQQAHALDDMPAELKALMIAALERDLANSGERDAQNRHW